MSQKLKEKGPKYNLLGKKATVTRKIRAIALLSESLFNVAWMCKQLNIQRRSFYRWKQIDPEFERACYELQEEIYDEAEVYLQKRIREGDTASLIFYLKTKVKHRGYIEKSEIEHSGMTASIINLIETPMEVIKNERIKNKSEADGNTKSSK